MSQNGVPQLSIGRLAEGIAAGMEAGDVVHVIGDAHSGGIMLETHNGERENWVGVGLPRPEVDDFADLIRQHHRRRHA